MTRISALKGNAYKCVRKTVNQSVANTNFRPEKNFDFLRKKFQKRLALFAEFIYTKKACLRR